MIGHSWGGHLALQVVCAIPERIEGVILIDPLGAYHEAVVEFGDNLIGRVPADLAERFEEIEARSDRGEASEEEQAWLGETMWRCYFAAPDRAPPRGQVRS